MEKLNSAKGFVFDAFLRYGKGGDKSFTRDERFIALRNAVLDEVAVLPPRDALQAVLRFKKSHTGNSSLFAESYYASVLEPLIRSVMDRIARLEINQKSPSDWEAMYDIVGVLFEKDRRSLSQLQYLIAEKAIRLMSFTDAKKFLNKLMQKESLPTAAIDYFQEHLMRTPEQMESASAVAENAVRNLQSYGNESLGGLASFDFIMEKSLEYGTSATDILSAALKSHSNDAPLRAVLAQVWYAGHMVLESEFKRLGSFKKIAESSEWDAEKIKKIIPFDEFVDGFYKQISQLDVDVILHKLLLSPRGALRSWEGRRLIVDTLKEQVDESDPELQKLLVDIGRAGLYKVDPVRLFVPIADIFRGRVFIRPAKPGKNDLAIKEVKQRFYMDEILHFGDIADQRKFVNALFAYKRFSVPEGKPSRAPLDLVSEEVLEACKQRILEITNPEKRQSSAEKVLPVDLILNVGKNMGAVGVRFLQLLGQYVDIPPEYRNKFDSIYDGVRGQAKWTAWQTLAREAKGPRATPELKSFYENLADLSPSIGGGSLMTVYVATMNNGQKFVLKVLNPNAEEFIRQYIDDARNILITLGLEKYPFAALLLADLEKWLMEDINSRHKTSPEDEFAGLHGSSEIVVESGNTVSVSVPQQVPTGSKYLLVEEFIEGKNLSELISSGDPAVRDYLDALEESYARQLDTFDVDGKTRIHTDVHIGNVRIGNNGKMYWIDRGHYIECTREEMQVLKPFLTGKGNLNEVQNALRYLVNLPENVSLKEKAKSPVFIMQISRDLLLLAAQFRGNNTSELADKLLIKLREKGLQIPIQYSLLFKNARALQKMRERVKS